MIESWRNQILEQIELQDRIIYHAYIPLERHLSKKNGRTIGRAGNRLIPTKSYELVQTEKTLVTEFLKQRPENFETIESPIWAIFLFYFEKTKFFTKKKEINRKLPDLSNLYELPQDCLQDAGIIANDSLVWSHDLSRRLPAAETGLEVILLNVDQDFVDFIHDQINVNY